MADPANTLLSPSVLAKVVTLKRPVILDGMNVEVDVPIEVCDLDRTRASDLTASAMDAAAISKACDVAKAIALVKGSASERAIYVISGSEPGVSKIDNVSDRYAALREWRMAAQLY